MIKKFKSFDWFIYVKQFRIRYKHDDISGMSAQITYYLILAFFPFLLFLINLLSFTSLSRELIFANFNTFLPNETGLLVKNVLAETLEARSGTLLLVGIIGSLWSASKGLSAIIKGLNRAYNVEENRNLIKRSLLAIFSTIGLTIIIILSFFMIVLGDVIQKSIHNLFGMNTLFGVIWTLFRYMIPLVVMFITFSLLYKYVPNRNLSFKNIRIGAKFATIGCIASSYLFSFYVNNFTNYAKVYGSLGGIIALIIWLYMSTLIIIVGGELISLRIYFQDKFKKCKV